MRYHYPIPIFPAARRRAIFAEEAFVMAKDAIAGWLEVTFEDQEEVFRAAA